MSTRQYIGARYVPKFATPIEWSSARSYEALEIVTYLNTSYTSKKAVPVGTAITNSEYWVATGNYNAQVEQYRQEVEGLAIYKNVIILGDSYGTENGSAGVISPTLPEYVQTYTKLPNTRFRASCQNGAGYCNGYYLSNLTTLASGMTADEKNKVTDIYVFGGWNDTPTAERTQSAFLTGADNLYTYAKTNFPNAIIHAGFWAGHKNSYDSDLMTTRGWYFLLGQHGYALIPNIDFVMHLHSYFFDNDQHHPNQSGVNALATFIARYILEGSANYEVTYQVTSSNISGATNFTNNMSGVNAVVNVHIFNDIAKLTLKPQSGNIKITLITEGVPTPHNWSLGGATYDIGTISDPWLYGNGSQIAFPVTIKIDYNGSGTVAAGSYIVPAFLIFNGTKLQLQMPKMQDGNDDIIIWNAVDATIINMQSDCVVSTLLV